MFRYLKYLILVSICAACGPGTTTPDKEADQSNHDSLKEETAGEQATPTKFPSPSELIEAINTQLGLGNMDSWTNMAGGYDMGEYLSTLEYSFGPPMPPSKDVKSTIEITIGSKDKSGSSVEYVQLGVGFINPSYKEEAKKKYKEKIKALAELLKIEIPSDILSAINNEQTTRSEFNGYLFEHEKYGGTREFLSLTIR